MKTPLIIIIIPALLIFTTTYSQVPKAIKLTDLENRITNSSDTTYIVNFWATWCVPCVKELPDFDSIHVSFQTQKVKVLLVSFDFKEEIESKLVPFLKKKEIKAEVVVLDETNANYFVPEISNNWSGAIPATLIKNNKKNTNLFFEQKLSYDFLQKEIEKLQ